MSEPTMTQPRASQPTSAAPVTAPKPARVSALGKVTVVQSGARDAYQVAWALAEAGMLEKLVTDLYWPEDRAWARGLASIFPASVRAMLLQRYAHGVPSARVRLGSLAGVASFALQKFPRAPFSWRRSMMRRSDAALGRTAGRLAERSGSGLLSYSYYGYDAFSHFSGLPILFQLHPHPISVRRILQAELEAHPDCAPSLRKEWELALPESDFDHLVAETRMAARFLAASSFTRRTLVENGADPGSIRVVPYGVDCNRFSPAPGPRQRPSDGKLRLLFVGTINQRKGIKYLLEALRLLDNPAIQLTVCGRVVDSLELFRPFGAQVEVRPSVSAEALLAAYRESDLFVFPSVAEGFAQVLLESLASGLPILSTTHTAAPDLIEHGSEGFIVEPRRPDLLAGYIQWALENRAELALMGVRARACAEQFTWARFRAGVASAVGDFLAASPDSGPEVRRHV